MDPEEEKKDERIPEGTCRQLRLLHEKKRSVRERKRHQPTKALCFPTLRSTG